MMQSKAEQLMLAYLAHASYLLKKYSPSPAIAVALLIAGSKLQTHNKMLQN